MINKKPLDRVMLSGGFLLGKATEECKAGCIAHTKPIINLFECSNTSFHPT